MSIFMVCWGCTGIGSFILCLAQGGTSESGHQTDRTVYPCGEVHWVSRLRENLMSGSDGEGLETGSRSTLNGHERGNPGDSQGHSLGLPRQSFTRQRTFAWLGNYRRLSKDYETLEQSGEAFIYMAMVDLMTKRLAGTSTPAFRS